MGRISIPLKPSFSCLPDCLSASREPADMNRRGRLIELFASLTPSSTNGLHRPTKKVCFGSVCDKLTAPRARRSAAAGGGHGPAVLVRQDRRFEEIPAQRR